MKGILEFNLPEDSDDFDLARDAVSMSIALNEFRDYLRGKIKYETLSEKEHEIFESVREKFFEILNDNDVSKYV